MKFKKHSVAIGVALALAGMTSAAQAGFINGNFETGDTTGWTIGGGSRAPYYNYEWYSGAPVMTPTDFLPGGTAYDASIASGHSAVVNQSYVDPNVSSVIGTTVYSGNYSLRVEDTTNGGYASVATQTVNNYTDANIFFAWKSVLLGAHDDYDAATMIIKLTDLTTGSDVITRQYNAADSGAGVDSRFSSYQGWFYTPDWQIEQLNIDSTLSGHDFRLSVLAADCEPTAHTGYVYLDGFGAVTPPGGDGNEVPEPGALALASLGLLAAAGAVRRRSRGKKA